MHQNEYVISTDLKRTMTSVVPQFVQYDKAVLIFKIYDNGVPFPVKDATEIEVTNVRPDGKAIIGFGSPIQLTDGSWGIRYSYLGSEMRVIGKNKVGLSMFKGKEKVSILPFDVHIIQDLREIAGSENAKDDGGLLTQLIESVQQTLEEATEILKDANQVIHEVQTEIDNATAIGKELTTEIKNSKEQTTLSKAATEDAKKATQEANAATVNSKTQSEETKKQALEAKNQSAEAKKQAEFAKGEGEKVQAVIIESNTQSAYAKQQGDYAKAEGAKATTATNTATTQANYAKQQGDYAKAEGAKATTATNDAKNATQETIKQAGFAQEQGQEAQKQANNATTQATYAKQQGDIAKANALDAKNQANFAKLEGEKVKTSLENVQEKITEVEKVKSETEKVKQDTILVADNAKTQAERAKNSADLAEPLINEMNIALPNVQNLGSEGEYSPLISYKRNNFVTYNGSSYVSLIDNNLGNDINDKTKWELWAQRGVDGKGAVSTVNNLSPDETGNVNLGDIVSLENKIMTTVVKSNMQNLQEDNLKNIIISETLPEGEFPKGTILIIRSGN